MSSDTGTTTTTNQHWLLDKYSQSRAPTEPPAKRAKLGQGGRTNNGDGAAGDDAIEWDHYTQPQLSLRLQTTFSASSSSSSSSSIVQSMLLFISFDPLFREATRNKQHLTLELLDLTSFSSPAIRAATPSDQLPLKAVYKDAVLGLRYVSLDAQPPRFKRLQVKFVSTEERERFVEAVGLFVPSKPAVDATSQAKGKTSSKTSTPRRKKQPPFSQGLSAAPSPSHSVLPLAANQSFATPQRVSELPYTYDFPSPLPAFSTAPQATASPSALAPSFPLRRSSSVLPSASIPPSLSALLPNLASSASQPPPPPPLPSLTASQQLAQLAPADFDQLLQDALLEEGFEALVQRVQATLLGQGE
ncbi:hypothetical protein JCM10207_005412 [Rhodosporidiobolus poonsookiae]